MTRPSPSPPLPHHKDITRKLKQLITAATTTLLLASGAAFAQVPQYGASVNLEQARKIMAGGAGLRVLTLRGANAVEGGVPITVDGKIIGAVGVSGGSAEQDGVVAKFGTDALAK